MQGKSMKVPHLAIIQVGDNPRSEVYIRQKEKFAHTIGAKVTIHRYAAEMMPLDLVKEVQTIADDPSVNGIIVQMPLPPQYSKDDLVSVLGEIPFYKDADGLTFANAGLLLNGSKEAVVPATTRGIANMLMHYNISVEGKHVVVIGRSNLVGKPTALHMMTLGATVTICHSKTNDLAAILKTADIIISATGVPKLVQAEYIRPDQVLIDVGISIDGAGKISGDIDFENVSKVLGETGAISPVPGGVGPLTVAGLFQNLLDLYIRQM